ncbi:MAG TPA: cell division protein ZapA [Eubacterium sp.]|nr:cell division protein ZapA [Eubacterium sp.]
MSVVSVVIDGSVIKLSSGDDEEYIQKVASYINGKISECKTSPSFKKQTRDMQDMIIKLNIADDYLKAKKRVEELEAELSAKNDEIYNLRHDTIALQIKADAANAEIDTLKSEVNRYQKNVVKLETELNGSKK